MLIEVSHELLVEAVMFIATGDDAEDLAIADRIRDGVATDSDWQVVVELAETLAEERSWSSN